MDQFFTGKILPAVTIEGKEDAVKLARTFLQGGLKVMEITFRTSVTTEAIKAIRSQVPGMTIGAGTILTPDQAEEAAQAGAHFGLAPGLNIEVVDAAKNAGLPFIPGVMTPSEIELAWSRGCLIQKLFPAGQLGGINMLRALSGPYGHTGIKFIPMGGVTIDNMAEYLKLDNVKAIGGSWLCDPVKIQNGRFDAILSDVKEALNRVPG